MYQIQNLTANAKQKQTLQLPDGSSIAIEISFISQQFGWFITTLTYLDFTLQGLRICNSPNMLHQFRNKIPFGIACVSSESREPSQQRDFFSGVATLYVLSKEETNLYAKVLSGEA